MPPHLKSHYEMIAAKISAADMLLIGAGAGMGVDSGLPDFRGDRGFWKAYPKFQHLGLSFSQMANPEWFERDPELAWGFYGHRFNMYRETQPHEGFEILKRWSVSKAQGSFIFTSNVDGHFQRAGFSEERIIECHGSISHWQCTRPCCEAIWESTEKYFTIDEVEMRCLNQLPECLYCGAIARPNILMFGDWHWVSRRADRQQKSYQQFLNKARNNKLVVLEFGAGIAVPTVRYECEYAGGQLIRVNPRDCEVPSGAMAVECGALEFLRAIDKLL